MVLTQSDFEARRLLVRWLNENFSQAPGFLPDSLGIRFAEQRHGYVAFRSILLSEKPDGFYVNSVLRSSRISHEQKRGFGALLFLTFQQDIPEKRQFL